MGYTPIPMAPPRRRAPLTALDAKVEHELEQGARLYVAGTLSLDALERWVDGALADYVERRDNPPSPAPTAVWGELRAGETAFA